MFNARYQERRNIDVKDFGSREIFSSNFTKKLLNNRENLNMIFKEIDLKYVGTMINKDYIISVAKKM